MADKPEKKKKPAEGDSEAAPKKAKAEKKVSAPVPEASEAPIEAPKPQTPSSKIPKLAKKNKSRLPRRQKKALQKATNAKQSVR